METEEEPKTSHGKEMLFWSISLLAAHHWVSIALPSFPAFSSPSLPASASSAYSVHSKGDRALPSSCALYAINWLGMEFCRLVKMRKKNWKDWLPCLLQSRRFITNCEACKSSWVETKIHFYSLFPYFSLWRTNGHLVSLELIHNSVNKHSFWSNRFASSYNTVSITAQNFAPRCSFPPIQAVVFLR